MRCRWGQLPQLPRYQVNDVCSSWGEELHHGKVNGIDGYHDLQALFTAPPRAKTVDDYAALLPWRMELGAG
jgi:hypothetical protein